MIDKTELINEQTTSLQLSEDLDQNTQMLKMIPGVKETIALSLGNFVFIPKREQEKGQEWKKTPINVDGQDIVLFNVKTETPHSVQLYPATAFNCEGLQLLFSAAPPPIEFYLCLKQIYEQRLLGPQHEAFFLENAKDKITDKTMLRVVFNKE